MKTLHIIAAAVLLAIIAIGAFVIFTDDEADAKEGEDTVIICIQDRNGTFARVSCDANYNERIAYGIRQITVKTSEVGDLSPTFRPGDECYLRSNNDLFQSVVCDFNLAKYTNFYILRDGALIKVVASVPAVTPTPTVTATPTSYPIVAPPKVVANPVPSFTG